MQTVIPEALCPSLACGAAVTMIDGLPGIFNEPRQPRSRRATSPFARQLRVRDGTPMRFAHYISPGSYPAPLVAVGTWPEGRMTIEARR